MKKYTTLALVMALCASLLVGCGCSGNVAVTTTPTAAPTTESTTVPTTEATTEVTTEATTEATTAPTTEPVPNPSSTPDTTQESGGMMDDMTGSEGNMDADRGSVPDDSTNGARGRRMR